MFKFFVENKQVRDNEIIITSEDVNHIKNVLRLKEDEKIEVCTKDSQNFLCIIRNINKDEVICDILEKDMKIIEPKTKITLFQGLPKGDKFEYIIEKCTEIGVTEITPVIMNRTIVKISDKQKKIEKWQKQAEAAAKQCKRNVIPKINDIISVQILQEIIDEYDIVLVAYEDEKTNNLRNVLKDLENKELKVGIIVGPEGGIDKSEIDILNKAKTVHLGNRILRTETAGLVMSTIILYQLGDLDER